MEKNDINANFELCRISKHFDSQIETLHVTIGNMSKKSRNTMHKIIRVLFMYLCHTQFPGRKINLSIIDGFDKTAVVSKSFGSIWSKKSAYPFSFS